MRVRYECVPGYTRGPPVIGFAAFAEETRAGAGDLGGVVCADDAGGEGLGSGLDGVWRWVSVEGGQVRECVLIGVDVMDLKLK